MRFYAVPYAVLNNYHVDIILFMTGHDKRLRNYEIYVILKVLYSEVQLYKVIELCRFDPQLEPKSLYLHSMCHFNDGPVVHDQVHQTKVYICVLCNGITGMVAQLIRRVVKLEA